MAPAQTNLLSICSPFFLPFPSTSSGFPISFLLYLPSFNLLSQNSFLLNVLFFEQSCSLMGHHSHWLTHKPGPSPPFHTPHTSSLLSLILHQTACCHIPDCPLNLVYNSIYRVTTKSLCSLIN